jgi:hypothetical protein
MFSFLSDAQIVALILLFLYALECFAWLPEGTLCCSARWGDVGRRYLLGGFLNNGRGAWIVTSPFPGGWSMLSGEWPVWLSPAGVCEPAGVALRDGTAAAESRFVAWDELQSVKAVEGEVRLNERRLPLMAPLPAAQHLVGVLRAVRGCPPHERAAAVECAYRQFTDFERARGRLQEFETATRWVTPAAGTLLNLLLLAAVWALAGARPFDYQWQILPVMLGVAIVLWLVLIVGFLRAHRRLFPARVAERRKQLAMIIFSPVAAARARHTLSRGLMSDLHPLAAAAVTLPAPQFQRLARRVLLDLEHPLLRPTDSMTGEASEGVKVENYGREKLRHFLDRLLRAAGEDPAAVVAPPQPQTPDAVAYCPRCDAEYVRAAGTCAGCGVPLRAFVKT